MPPEVLPIAALALSIATFAYTATRNRNTDQQKAVDELRKAIEAQTVAVSSNSARLSVVEAKLGPLWTIIEKGAASILHHPTEQKRDYLIDRYMEGKLTATELQEFVHVLHEIVEDKDKAAGERMAATMMLAAVSARKASV